MGFCGLASRVLATYATGGLPEVSSVGGSKISTPEFWRNTTDASAIFIIRSYSKDFFYVTVCFTNGKNEVDRSPVRWSWCP